MIAPKEWRYLGKTWTTITPQILGDYQGSAERLTEHGVQLALFKKGTQIEFLGTQGKYSSIDFNFKKSLQSEADLRRAISIQYYLYDKHYSAVLQELDPESERELYGNLNGDIEFCLLNEKGVLSWGLGDQKFPLASYPDPDSLWIALNAPLEKISPEFQSTINIGCISPVLLERLSQANYTAGVSAFEATDQPSSSKIVSYSSGLWFFYCHGYYGEVRGNLQHASDIYTAMRTNDTDLLLKYLFVPVDNKSSFDHSRDLILIEELGRFQLRANLGEDRSVPRQH
jgi:hypothetical protein